MLRQYQELKQQHPGTLLFFRLGDFYELFFDDAVVGSRELQITLTARQKDSENPIPMCGVPHHSAATYIALKLGQGIESAIPISILAVGDVLQAIAMTLPERRQQLLRELALDSQLIEARHRRFHRLATRREFLEPLGLAFSDAGVGEAERPDQDRQRQPLADERYEDHGKREE